MTGNGAFSLDPDSIVRYENSNRLELQYKIERIEVEYAEDQYYDPTGTLASYGQAVSIADRNTTNKQKSKFLVDYIDKVPNYIRDLQTEESIQRILDRFRERESLEELDGSQLKVDMPDDYYYPKARYEQSGIIFCPHVNTTGVSVNVNADLLRQKCDVGSFLAPHRMVLFKAMSLWSTCVGSEITSYLLWLPLKPLEWVLTNRMYVSL